MIAKPHRCRVLGLFCCIFFFACNTLAHKSSDSYLTVRVEGTAITGQWDIALGDLEHAIGLDTNGDGEITRGELRDRQQAVASYALSRLHVRADETPQSLRVTEQLVEEFPDGTYAVLRFVTDLGAEPHALEFDYRAFFDLDHQHRGLLRLEHAGKTQTAIFSPDRPTQRFELASPSAWRQFLDFGGEGVWHIWIGYDHILFLLALLLPSVLRRETNAWKAIELFRPALINVLKIVTAFTVAHSITLSLAALNIVQIPARVVEPAIAGSVILAAANNVRTILPERGWLIAFGFGLVHGFGFANVLAELGLEKGTLALALVGFNLGVEVGQLAIVAVFVPVAFALRASWFYQRLAFRFGSAAIVLLATIWMVERIWKVQVLPL
jgi:hypothetical protein